MKYLRLDDTDGDSLPQVSDSESSKGREVGVGLDTEGLLGNELDNGGITGLDELRGGLHDLTCLGDISTGTTRYRRGEKRGEDEKGSRWKMGSLGFVV